MKKRVLIACFILLLSACSEKSAVAPTEGRQSIAFTRTVEAEKAVKPLKIAALSNGKESRMAYGDAANRRARLQLPDTIKLTRSVSIGEGIDTDAVTVATPVISNGVVYTLDSAFVLQAIRLENGDEVFRVELPEVLGTTAKSIGLALDDKQIYAVAGNGLVMAVNSQNGKIVWQKELNAPLRSSPVVRDGRLFVSSVNNDLFALKTADGVELWRYRGEPTVTNFFGMGTPAVSGKTVVMPTTTGRVNAFDAATGVMIWTETMWSSRTFNPLLDLPHVTASPVVENGIVYVVGNAGKTGAYHLSNGRQIFETDIGGRETPAVSGDALFLISNQNELLALNKKSGQVYWKTILSGEDKKTIWHGPVLAGEWAIVTSSAGDVIFFDIQSGKEIRRDKQESLYGAPVTVAGTMVLITNDGDMLFYQ